MADCLFSIFGHQEGVINKRLKDGTINFRRLTPEEKQRRVEEDEAMKEKAKEILKQQQMQAKKVCAQGLQWNICWL